MTANALSAPWVGPNGGWPAFDKVQVKDFKPAFEAAMAANLKEIDAITANTAPATFDNTIVALEKAGTELARVRAYYGVWTSNLLNDELEAVQTEMDPKLAAFQDSITQNAKLFARIEAVYTASQQKGSRLAPEQTRLSWLYWNNFVRAGAKLDDKAKARVGEINQKLAALFAKFGQNLQGRRRHLPSSSKRPTSKACRSRSKTAPLLLLKSAATRANSPSRTRARRWTRS